MDAMDAPPTVPSRLSAGLLWLHQPGRLWIVVLSLVLFAALVWTVFIAVIVPRGVRPVVTIGERTWTIMETAATQESRVRGLSFRQSLEPGTGMLFVFAVPEQAGFWMKDMRFPIDIVYIRNGVVDSIALDRQPGDLTPVYSVGTIDRVLEVNAGEARDIEPGDAVRFASVFSWSTFFSGK